MIVWESLATQPKPVFDLNEYPEEEEEGSKRKGKAKSKGL
jgi:hypothetical protein